LTGFDKEMGTKRRRNEISVATLSPRLALSREARPNYKEETNGYDG